MSVSYWKLPTRLVWVLLSLFILGGIAPLTTIAQDDDSTGIIGPEDYPAGVNPLTGLPVDDPDLLDRRPLLVKISNYPPVVRPQSGLMEADVVWETLLAGGVTRFSAVYLSNDPERIGPIRSGRLVDFELTRIYRSLFVYSGMSRGTIEVLSGDRLVSSRAVSGIEPCPALCRYPEEGIALEHTLYGDASALRELAVDRDRDVEPETVYGMAFSEDAPDGGIATDRIDIAWRGLQAEWTYDDNSGRWLRSTDGEDHFDATTEEQVSAANVVIVEEEHTVQAVIEPGFWGPGDFAFSVNFIGEGRIFLFRDGNYYPGTWQRATREDPFTFFDDNGDVLPFKPGNTFFALVPEWIDGYQLTFHLSDPPTIVTGTTTGVPMHSGPGEAYRLIDVTYPGDTFSAIGVNRGGEWIQVLREGFEVVWVPFDSMELDDADLSDLPIPRPIIEP